MIQVNELFCGYGSKEVVKQISFSIEKGTVLSILGANGSGKSTLLKALVGILPYKGEILIEEKDAKELEKKQRASLIAYVPQSSTIPFEFSVLEIVLMGRFHSSSLKFSYSQNDKDEAMSALKQVGIESFATKVFKNLSGGEKQLVLIARALAQKSKIIIMDEPVTGLDLGNQMRLLDLINSLKSSGKIIIQTTHYPDHALHVSTKVLWLEKGEILAFGSPKEVITPKRILHIYNVRSEIYKSDSSGREYILPEKFLQKDSTCLEN